MSDLLTYPRQCFAASNSCEGFKSYYSDVFSDRRVDRLYIIKGGPGTGKSHFMRMVARYARGKGYDVTEYHCSSDPASLDGLYLTRGDTPPMGFLDGTPPHVREPVLPGARDEMVNLGVFWNSKALAGKKSLIAALGQKKSAAYENAYAALSAAGKLDGIADRLAEECIRHDRLRELAHRLLRSQPAGEGFETVTALRSAYSMAGKHTLRSYEAAAHRLLLPDEGYGLGYGLTAAMLEASRARGHRVWVSYHPVYAHKIDGLLYPDTGLCVLVGEGGAVEKEGARPLSLRRCLIPEALRPLRAEIRRTVALREQLAETALGHLSVAAQSHFELEKLYAEAMDFRAKEGFTDDFCRSVFGE